MTTERINQAMDVFSAVVDRSPDQQKAHLDEVCVDDSDLRVEVEDLLADHAMAEKEGFLKEPAWVIDQIPVYLPDFDEYERIEYIGHGGMGMVYRAFDTTLDTQVALKMSLPRRLTTVEDISRYRTEPKSMAKLKHPNIVQVHKVGECHGQPYFTMNLIQGGSLDEHLPRFKDDAKRAAQVMVKVARAVHHAHQRSILHRDLKPANILMDDEGNPYVTDFGLAKQLGADEKLTETGEPLSTASGVYQNVVGTASYMSPEQADPRPDRDVTTLSDVYGLGTILYALQTGQPPFRGDTIEETLSQVVDADRKPTAPRQLNPDVDRTLQAVCLKCLEKSPLDRYRSAEGLAKDLGRWLAHQPTEATPPNPVQRLRLWCRRNPVGLVVAALLLALLTLAGLNVADRLKEPRHAQAALARHQADTLDIRLQQLSQAVASVDEEYPRIGELLLQGNQPDLQALIEEVGNSRVDLDGSSPFESWFVIDSRDGAIVARWPEMHPATENVDFWDRDYIESLNPASNTYVSQIFKAISDKKYEFGISAWVQHNGQNVGVVVTSVTTSKQMGLPETEEQGFVTALLARRDSFRVPGETGTRPEGASDFIVLLHPSYERGIEPVWFPERYLAAMESGYAENYWDPVVSLNDESAQRYAGLWTTSFAPVADSEFVVLIQQRHSPFVPRGFWPKALLAVAAIFLTLAIRYVYRKS